MKSIKTGLAYVLTAVVATLFLCLQADVLKASEPTNSKIEDLGWLSGSWESAGGSAHVEEHWTRASGGTMIGMGRTIAQGKTVFFEYLRIETRTDGIYYVAHPKARPGTDFKLVRVEARSATFENLAHDFPKRIIYRKNHDGTLTARVEGDGSEKEKPQEFILRPLR